ncbi:MAG TPA: trigger factor [Gammaproteobacteria bacterium]|nr:trigger factor [Gammaproteobacteria bacterium]
MVSVESTQGLERRMKVEVPAERVESEIDKRLKDMGRRAKIKGFRPGKAPLKVVRQQYGAQVREDVVAEFVRNSWVQAISEQKLRPVGSPRIEEHNVSKDEGLSFTAVFEVFPDIELTGHEGLEIERPAAEITGADVDAMIDKLRGQRMAWDEVERAAGDGDRVTIDFSGAIDGEAFRGGDGNEVGIVLGEGRMLKDFEAGLQGIKPGEERTIGVEFPADYGSADVAGKKAEFKVKARKVEQSRLPEVDEEFCRAFGVEEGGVELFRAEVEENMREELQQRVRESVKRQLLDKLVAAHDIDVPVALVEQEIQSLREDMVRRMNPNAKPEGATELPPREPFEQPARFRVALGMLIGEIVRQHELRVDQAQVQQRLQQIGASYGDAETVIKIYRSNPELMSQVETSVMEEQVVDWLLERAKIVDKPIKFSQLMNQDQA